MGDSACSHNGALGPVHSAILDCEVVAIFGNSDNLQLGPFQMVATKDYENSKSFIQQKKKQLKGKQDKDHSIRDSEIVLDHSSSTHPSSIIHSPSSLCLIAFDLLQLNNTSLLHLPLTQRRHLLHQHFGWMMDDDGWMMDDGWMTNKKHTIHGQYPISPECPANDRRCPAALRRVRVGGGMHAIEVKVDDGSEVHMSYFMLASSSILRVCYEESWMMDDKHASIHHPSSTIHHPSLMSIPTAVEAIQSLLLSSVNIGCEGLMIKHGGEG